MKVKVSLKLEVLSFQGFSTKSLVYGDIFPELGSVVFSDGSGILGERLVCPNDCISLVFDIKK